MTYQATTGAGDYGTLTELAAGGIIDNVLGSADTDVEKADSDIIKQ